MKPRISKQAGSWTVARPAFGFGPPTTTRYPSWRAAMSSIDRTAGIVPLTTEITHQPHDGLAAVPAWDWRWRPPDARSSP